MRNPSHGDRFGRTIRKGHCPRTRVASAPWAPWLGPKPKEGNGERGQAHHQGRTPLRRASSRPRRPPAQADVLTRREAKAYEAAELHAHARGAWIDPRGAGPRSPTAPATGWRGTPGSDRRPTPETRSSSAAIWTRRSALARLLRSEPLTCRASSTRGSSARPRRAPFVASSASFTSFVSAPSLATSSLGHRAGTSSCRRSPQPPGRDHT